jgi:glycerol uptake facilitator-like aquaporin
MRFHVQHSAWLVGLGRWVRSRLPGCLVTRSPRRMGNASLVRLSPVMPRFAKPGRQTAPFFEAADAPSLTRRAIGEGIATAGLTMAVVFCSQATWLGALRPLAPGLGVPAAVAALTLSFGPATGAHFNPLVTACQWVRGHRNARCLIAYVSAQCVGALIGAGLAGLLIPPALHVTPAPIAVVIGSEVFATAGLLTIVLAASLVTGPEVGLLGVTGWLIMLNLAAPAGPFANPVLALAAPLALGTLNLPFLLAHVVAELAGAAIAVLIIAVIYPSVRAGPARGVLLRAGVAAPAEP